MAKAPYDPFRADGTWNWEAARDMTDDQLKDAWDRHKAKASKSSSQEPVDTDPVEHAAFNHWIKVESKGQHTRGTMDYWRERWLEEGRAVWLEFGKDEFLWNLSKRDRSAFQTFCMYISKSTADPEARRRFTATKESNERHENGKDYFYSAGNTYANAGKNWFEDWYTKSANFRDFQQGHWKQEGDGTSGFSDAWERAKAGYQGQQRQWGGDSVESKKQKLQNIMRTQFDMIASAYGEHERKRRRMEENEYRANNPVGVIKIVSTPTLQQRIWLRLMREVDAGMCTKAGAYELANRLFPEAQEMSSAQKYLAEQTAEVLLNPLSNFSYYAQ